MAASPKVSGPFEPLSWQLLIVRKTSGNSELLLAVCGSRETEAEEHGLSSNCPDPPRPSEQVSKVFLMEKDQVEEVTYDVSPFSVQYLSQEGRGWVG